MPFFENISLEVSGNDFNLTTNVNKEKVKGGGHFEFSWGKAE